MKPKVNAYPPPEFTAGDFCPECKNHFTQGHDAECSQIRGKWGSTEASREFEANSPWSAEYWLRRAIIDFGEHGDQDWDRFNEHALHGTEEHEPERHQLEPIHAAIPQNCPACEDEAFASAHQNRYDQARTDHKMDHNQAVEYADKHAAGDIPYVLEDMSCSHGRHAHRKQAWTGWGPEQVAPHHKVADWDWDNHLNAYVSTASPRQFTCDCGQGHSVPGYSNCKCGKIWNSYVIGTGGDRHEASVEKFLCREIPSRPDVIVASRRRADMDHELSTEFPQLQHGDVVRHVSDSYDPRTVVDKEGPGARGSGLEGVVIGGPKRMNTGHPNLMVKWKHPGKPEDWFHGEFNGDTSHHSPDELIPTGRKYPIDQQGRALVTQTWQDDPMMDTHRQDLVEQGRMPASSDAHTVRQWNPDKDPFDPREFGARRRHALHPDDLVFPGHGYDLDSEVEDVTPFPSDHHPSAGEATMRAAPTDWHSRSQDGKWTSGGAPSAHQFKKRVPQE